MNGSDSDRHCEICFMLLAVLTMFTAAVFILLYTTGSAKVAKMLVLIFLLGSLAFGVPALCLKSPPRSASENAPNLTRNTNDANLCNSVSLNINQDLNNHNNHNNHNNMNSSQFSRAESDGQEIILQMSELHAQYDNNPPTYESVYAKYDIERNSPQQKIEEESPPSYDDWSKGCLVLRPSSD